MKILTAATVKSSWLPHSLGQVDVCLALNVGKRTSLSIANVTFLTQRHVRRVLAAMWEDRILSYREWYDTKGKHAKWRIARPTYWSKYVMPRAVHLMLRVRN